MKEKMSNVKEKLENVADNITLFVGDTVYYVLNHPVVSTVVTISTVYFVASIHEMLKDD